MKQAIHPQWFETNVSCACGNHFTVGGTKAEIRVEICSKCHPFFTGEMKFVDALGRVDKFQQKMEKAKEQAATQQAKKQKKQDQETQRREQKSLKDMLMGIK